MKFKFIDFILRCTLFLPMYSFGMMENGPNNSQSGIDSARSDIDSTRGRKDLCRTKLNPESLQYLSSLMQGTKPDTVARNLNVPPIQGMPKTAFGRGRRLSASSAGSNGTRISVGSDGTQTSRSSDATILIGGPSKDQKAQRSTASQSEPDVLSTVPEATQETVAAACSATKEMSNGGVDRDKADIDIAAKILGGADMMTIEPITDGDQCMYASKSVVVKSDDKGSTIVETLYAGKASVEKKPTDGSSPIKPNDKATTSVRRLDAEVNSPKSTSPKKVQCFSVFAMFRGKSRSREDGDRRIGSLVTELDSRGPDTSITNAVNRVSTRYPGNHFIAVESDAAAMHQEVLTAKPVQPFIPQSAIQASQRLAQDRFANAGSTQTFLDTKREQMLLPCQQGPQIHYQGPPRDSHSATTYNGELKALTADTEHESSVFAKDTTRDSGEQCCECPSPEVYGDDYDPQLFKGGRASPLADDYDDSATAVVAKAADLDLLEDGQGKCCHNGYWCS